MEYAKDEAVRRLQGVPYSNDTINGMKSPSHTKWVFAFSYEKKIKKFLLRDNSDYRKSNNFTIKPSGEIWIKLCQMYNLKDITKSAFHIFNYMTNPEISTLCHYSFAPRRPNEEWRGKPVRQYEIQPLLDISRLPEFHYLPYEEAVKIVDDLCQLGSVPAFLTTPDFFLPSKYKLLEDREEDTGIIDGIVESVSFESNIIEVEDEYFNIPKNILIAVSI
ncbi:unnamed protein product [Mytilus edulis]|uniref:Uncharacterized protein n=1 Tax=Mytilus edulis TaxID=6550 RepID=A0A8S3TFL7_MYTED|nr:unnamed protein product [Mytilus edulis]